MPDSMAMFQVLRRLGARAYMAGSKSVTRNKHCALRALPLKGRQHGRRKGHPVNARPVHVQGPMEVLKLLGSA